MAIILSKKELDNIKEYKYSTSPATPMDGVFDPWWNWCVDKLPMVGNLVKFLLIFLVVGVTKPVNMHGNCSPNRRFHTPDSVRRVHERGASRTPSLLTGLCYLLVLDYGRHRWQAGEEDRQLFASRTDS